MPNIDRVLFVQTPSVIDRQRELVASYLVDALGVSVEFASSPEDVKPGSAFDVVMTPTLPWVRDVFSRLTAVKWVHFLSSGVDKIWEMDVDWGSFKLTSSKGVHAVPISEYVLGAMLHFAKRFDQFCIQSQQKVWRREWLLELTDAKVVVVGAGSIGRAVTERSRLFGMHVRNVARVGRVDPDLGSVFSFEELPTAVTSADYLVVAVPLTPDTAGMIDDDILSTLKRGAVLIDVSRGGVVPGDCVARALDSGSLRGAALDVFDSEPLASNSRLWNRTDVLLTPHVAGTTSNYMMRVLSVFVQQAERYRSGEPFFEPVRPERGY